MGAGEAAAAVVVGGAVVAAVVAMVGYSILEDLVGSGAAVGAALSVASTVEYFASTVGYWDPLERAWAQSVGARSLVVLEDLGPTVG